MIIRDSCHYEKVHNWLPQSIAVLRLCYFTSIGLPYVRKLVLASRIMCRFGLYTCVTGILRAQRQGIVRHVTEFRGILCVCICVRTALPTGSSVLLHRVPNVSLRCN
jgi:hypothetical protein